MPLKSIIFLTFFIVIPLKSIIFLTFCPGLPLKTIIFAENRIRFFPEYSLRSRLCFFNNQTILFEILVDNSSNECPWKTTRDGGAQTVPASRSPNAILQWHRPHLHYQLESPPLRTKFLGRVKVLFTTTQTSLTFSTRIPNYAD